MTDSNDVSVLAKFDAWLKSHRLGVLIGVVLFALTVRFCVFAQVLHSPVMHSYRYEQMDMKFFDNWAMAIAQHDALGREPDHPLHVWHGRVAASHFAAHPDLLGGKKLEDLEQDDQREAVRTLWDRWYKGNRFHQEPLYPYLIGAAYKLWGAPDVRVVCVLQLLGGVLTVMLLFLATRGVLGDVTALLTACMASVWGPLIHFELTMLRASVITLAGVALLYSLQRLFRARDRGDHRLSLRLFGFGCLVGLATAIKTTFLLFSVGVLFGLLWPLRRQMPQLVRHSLVVGAGAGLVLAPWFVRNYMVGAPLFSLTSVAAVTFAGTNYPGYVPAFGWYPFNDSDVFARIMDDSGGDFLSAVQVTLGMHTFGSYLSLLWHKFALVWHWLEIPNNTNYYFTIVHSSILAFTRYLVATSWVMPAAVVGMTIAIVQRRAVLTWLWFWAISIAPLVVFYVLSRFRVPLVVAMMPFAAFAMVQILDWVLHRRIWPAVLSIVVVGSLTAVMCRDIYPPRPVLGAGAYSLAITHYYMPRVEAALKAKDRESAVKEIEALIDSRPKYLDEIGGSRPIADTYENAMVGEVFVPTYLLYKAQLEALGAARRAAAAETEARRLARAAELYNAKNPNR